MATDPILGWNLLDEGTTQAEVLVNEMLGRILAGLMRIQSYGDTAPPGSPVNFDTYLIGTPATGDWSGQEDMIAVYLDGWKFMTPTEGMRLWVMDTNTEIFFDGTAWRPGSGGFQTLVDGASIPWNLALGGAAQVTLGGNRTLAAPSNLVEGQLYVLHVIQDGTGSRTLTWNAIFVWPAAATPTLTTTAGREDVFRFHSRNGKLYASTVGLNYTP